MVQVKAARSYDSSRRREQAERNRAAVLDAAWRLFEERGYGATTVSAVAAAAGVSAETVYKAFGGKAGLVRALWERGLAGRGMVHAQKRSDAMMREHEADSQAIARAWGGFITEVMPATAPVLLLVRAAAATAPEMARLRVELEDSRLARMEANARFLADHHHLRAGLTVEYARDILFAYSAPELYELLVLRQGWSPENYGVFIGESVSAALLSAPAEP
ncbi:TetR family transcriptional regulator [Streptomyces sp. NPDC088353]|uniref:TetR family transcriptional regulator n=1 Tax=Streptomyces sp. NPDC088353 TaxID=3365855 RepID=UPI0038208BC0